MTTLASDTFTDADGIALSAHVPTIGASWAATVTIGADFVIATNRIRGNDNGYRARQARLDSGGTFPDDYTVGADFVFHTATLDDAIGLGARSPVSGTGGYYLCYETESARRRFKLTKGDGIQGTSLGTYAYPFPAEGTVVAVELVVSGTTITAKVAGVAVIAVTDSSYTSGVPTVYFQGNNVPTDFSSVHIDNFSVTAGNTASIAIYATGQLPGVSSGFRLMGQAYVSPGSPTSFSISWETADIAWTATVPEINQAIQDAAINAVAAQGYTVSALDNKILVGGAVGVM